MAGKSRRHRHKKKNFMSSAVYYLVIAALIVGLIFVVKENRQHRAERTEYKKQLASQETEEDIGVLDEMMVRPTAEPTDTPEEEQKK